MPSNEEVWISSLQRHFTGPSVSEINISIKNPTDTVQTIELLAQALMWFYEQTLSTPELMHWVTEIQNNAGDAYEYLTDQGDFG
jgi:hypothetical protein